MKKKKQKDKNSPSMTLLTWKTKEKLNELVNKGETYDEGIYRILEEYEVMKKKR